jgi:LacI family transcriptional regulator
MPNAQRPPTMHDVARLADVSQTTVSFVLNGREDVNISEDTRERIWVAVKELGYRPNAMARSLRSSRSQTIGFISDEIASTPYAGQIVIGAQDAAWEAGKLLLLVNTGGLDEVKEAAVQTLLERQVDGLIYATMYHRVAHPPALVRQIPTVLLDCYVEDRSLPSVVPDELSGGRTAAEVLLQKGHRRIGFINNRDPIPATFFRLEGYKEALATAGIAFDPILVHQGPSDQRGGYQGAMALMQLPEPPTALFCFNDRVAMGAYDALRKLNLRIPDDVAVMGFDNQEIISGHLYPPLSTMELPHYQMGEWAVNFLLEHITAAPPATQHTIACPYIERQSI